MREKILCNPSLSHTTRIKTIKESSLLCFSPFLFRGLVTSQIGKRQRDMGGDNVRKNEKNICGTIYLWYFFPDKFKINLSSQ